MQNGSNYGVGNSEATTKMADLSQNNGLSSNDTQKIMTAEGTLNKHSRKKVVKRRTKSVTASQLGEFSK